MVSTQDSLKYYLEHYSFNCIHHFRNKKVPGYNRDTKNNPFNVRGQMQGGDKA